MEIVDRRIEVLDIETIINCFTYSGFNIDTKEKVQFVLHESRDDRNALCNHLNSLKYLIGYNIEGFDYPILHLILDNVRKLSLSALIELIYNKSQAIIRDQENPFTHTIPEWKRKIPICDLFKIWHFDNQAKKCSLKWIQYSIDWPNIEEMPIPHDVPVTEDQIQFVLDYNDNDTMSTNEFWKITIGDTEHPLYKGIDKIQLRKDIKQEFGISCGNYNDVKIGDSINKIIYSKFSNIDIKDIPKRGTVRGSIKVSNCIQIPIEFDSPELQHFYKEFLKKEFNPTKLKDSKDDGLNFNFRGLQISFGFGGIHSVDKPRIVITDKDYYLSDKDCTGMYPRAIIEQQLYPEHLGEHWYKGCEYIYNKRANEYKPQSKKDKRAQSFSEAFKAASNGGSLTKIIIVFEANLLYLYINL